MGPKTRFHSLLELRIKQVVEAEQASIISGLPKDYSQYRENVGYIRGLMDALKLCDQIEEDLDK